MAIASTLITWSAVSPKGLQVAHWKMARMPVQRLTHSGQAHPPAAGGQPLPALLQHQAFFGTDQPATQLANPALQSNGGEVVMQPPP